MKTETMIDLNHLTTAELERALDRRKREETEKKAQARERYEAERDQLVNRLVQSAIAVSHMLADFKRDCFRQMENMREKAQAYGDIRRNSKDGFGLRATDTKHSAVLRRNTVHEYDERADLALGLIREFLEKTIKRKDAQTHRTISALLQRNKGGDLNPSRVADLLKIKDNYDDERWVKAMELLTESYREREVSYNIEFTVPDAQGKDETICLTFASMPLAATHPVQTRG